MGEGKISYWLKGGIIGLILDIVYNLFELVLYRPDLNKWFIFLIIDLIFVFIVGAIIGFFFGKIIKGKVKKTNKKLKNKKSLRKTRKK